MSEKRKIDKIDAKILLELLQNARKPITQIAKSCHVSKELARYRTKQLQNKHIIHSFYTEIDYFKLGWMSAVLFVKVSAEKLNEVKKYIESQKNMSWSCEFSGAIDFGTSIFGQDMREINNAIENFFLIFEKSIKGSRVYYHDKISFHSEKIFEMNQLEQNEMTSTKCVSPKPEVLKTLEALNTNSTATSLSIAKERHIDEKTIRNHIKQLERKGIITKYTALINIEALNLFSFNIFFHNTNPFQRQKLFKFIQSHPHVHYAVSFLNEDIVEAGVFVKSQYDLKDILNQIEEAIEGTSLGDILFIQKDLLSFGLPQVIFKE